VVNDSTASLNILAGVKGIGTLTGLGRTRIAPGATLEVASVEQAVVTVEAGGALHVYQADSSIEVLDRLDSAGLVTFSGNLDLFGAVRNAGSIEVADLSTARFFGPVVGGGRFTGGGTVEFLDEVGPGDSIGQLDFGGDVLFANSAALEVEIAPGAGNVQHDRMVIAGSAGLAGTLEIATLANLELEVGQTFDVLMAAGGVTGQFTVLDLSNAEPRFEFDVHYYPDLVQIEVVDIPEPATLNLLGLGWCALAVLGRSAARPRD
jgi:hypothetical protein